MILLFTLLNTGLIIEHISTVLPKCPFQSISHSFIAQGICCQCHLDLCTLSIVSGSSSFLFRSKEDICLKLFPGTPIRDQFYAVIKFKFYLKLYCNSYVLNYNLGNDWVPFLFNCSFKDAKQYTVPRGNISCNCLINC